jgi:glucoamylase
MPKSLVLGNGHMLLCFDDKARVRDFYYHHVGLENHAGSGCVHRIGIMIDGEFSWIEDVSWQVQIAYQQDSLVSKIRMINENLGIALNFKDTVYNEKCIFLRNVTVENLWDSKRAVKIFFHQQFRIYDTERRDTGYYDPDRKIITHYEGRRVFIVGGRQAGKSFDDYCVGNYGIEGKEGTWRDAEDGMLAKNPIEHGPVDSVIAFTFEVEGKGKKVVDYWVVAAKILAEARSLHDHVLARTPNHLMESTEDYWRAWVNKSKIDFKDLDEESIDLFKRSLLIIRTHSGNEGGIVASADSDMLQYGRDTYAYVWPRDGAFVAMSLIQAKHFSIARKFFEFCNDVISEDGYFFHKYRSDKSIGSSWHPWAKEGKKQLAIQEDETALILYSLWEYYEATLNIEFIESIYNSLIKKAAEFMYHYRDKRTGLPKESYDIWEQDYGTSTFSSSTVYGGFIAASKFAEILGKEDDMEKYRHEAEEIKLLILKYLHNSNNGYFYKRITSSKEGFNFDDTIDISSFFGLFYFNIIDIDDPMLDDAFSVVERELFCDTKIGGVMRYVGDKYHQVHDNLTGNPWIITTLWVAQYRIKKSKTLNELEEVKKVFDWVCRHATTAGILPEQINSDTGEHLSAAPLTWSHSEYVTTILQYLKKREELEGR